MRAPRSSLIRLSLVLQIMLVAGGPQGALVLCIDPGRHVSIELGESRCIAGAQITPSTAQRDELAGCSTDACVSCVDVPVGTNGMRHAAPRAPQLSSPTVALVQLVAHVQSATGFGPSTNPTGPNSLALSIPTTILRV